jgi:hypothetical protein
MGVKLDNEHWHDRAPKLLETSHEGKVTILGNQQVQTDRIFLNNKPDIIIADCEFLNALEQHPRRTELDLHKI